MDNWHIPIQTHTHTQTEKLTYVHLKAKIQGENCSAQRQQKLTYTQRTKKQQLQHKPKICVVYDFCEIFKENFAKQKSEERIFQKELKKLLKECETKCKN